MAQVDTSIYSNLLHPVKSVQEYDADAQQAEGNKLGLLIQRGQYDQQQRGVAEDNAFRTALSSGADEKALMAASPTRATALLKARAEIAKEQAQTGLYGAQAGKAKSDASKTDWETAVAKQAHIAQLASSATDQASWTQARKIAEMLGADVSQVPEQFDPATAKQFGSMAMTQAQRLDQAHKEAQLAETTRNNKAQVGATYASIAERREAAKMADSRARESNAATVSRPFEVTSPDGAPQLVQQDKQGNIRPVQGYGPKAQPDKPLNDSQSKALLFGSRARDSDKVLGELAKDGTLASTPGSRAPLIGGMIGALQGANGQSLDQAKRDFMTTVLRRESGASIAPSEFDTADKQYFPQIGDSQKVILQKAANRKLVIDGILAEVPEKQRGSLGGGASNAGGLPPDVAAALKKHGAK